MTPLLEAENICRFFTAGRANILALSPFSLQVHSGEFLTITGPSGAGKSTLLNLLSGLDRPSEGTVRFHGTSISSLSDGEVALFRNSHFGFIFQTPHLLPNKTVFENVALPFQYGKTFPATEIRLRCQELLEYVGLEGAASRYPNTLSGGEMQRVVFARALARKPKVIFADEPTGSLDGHNAKRILSLLEAQAAEGCTVIMVSHDKEAICFGTRMIALEKIQSAER